MTVHLRQEFLGLNTDVEPNRLPSGTADVALNVSLDNGSLKKRGGFSEYEDEIASGYHALNIFIAHFGPSTLYTAGSSYIVVKTTNGTTTAKLYQKRVYPTVEANFTEITSERTHSYLDEGWFFMWRDRLHHFDRAGGTRWHPEHVNAANKAYRAGMPRLTTAPNVVAIAGGEKDGRYHTHVAYRNSATDEVGVVSPPNTTGGAAGVVVCSLKIDRGGIWYDALTLPTTHEVDRVGAYCTMGNTEFLERGGAGYECFSYDAYLDAITTTRPGLNKADHVLHKDEAFTNEGGEPPGSRAGCFTGSRAIYGQVYSTLGTPGPSANLIPNTVFYSVPNWPTAVPQRVTYSATKSHSGTGDSTTFIPKPYVGEITSGFDGHIRALAAGGGRAVMFTSTAAYAIATAGDGRLYTQTITRSKGCAASKACVGTINAIHAMGETSWLRISDTVDDISHKKFRTTLDDIPAGYAEVSCMAEYSHKSQVWCAVVQSGQTKAKRILIWDETLGPEGGLTIYEPVCLGETEGITCMVELAYHSAEPTMLVATDAGNIFQFPSGTIDKTTDYACSWQGYFGQERLAYNQKISGLTVLNGGNCSANVTVSIKQLRSPDESIAAKTHVLSTNDQHEPILMDFEPRLGRFFQVKFSSTAASTGEWEIHDLTLALDRE